MSDDTVNVFGRSTLTKVDMLPRVTTATIETFMRETRDGDLDRLISEIETRMKQHNPILWENLDQLINCGAGCRKDRKVRTEIRSICYFMYWAMDRQDAEDDRAFKRVN